MSRAPADRARLAVAAAFAVNGAAFGSWVSRVPAVRDGLDLTPAQLGLLLLCPGVGSMVGLPLAGWLVARVGPARAVLAGVAGVAAALAGAAAGLRAGWPPLAAAGAGAGVPVVAQLLATSLAVLAAAAAVVRGFLPVPHRPRERGIGLGRAWREPRTLLLGVMVLAFAFTEGVANDWLALALVDGHRASEAVGAAAYGVFVAALSGGRLAGGALLERAGRAGALRGLAATAAAGVLLVVLAGPPLVGLLAGTWGVRPALLAVLVALAAGAAAAAAARPAGQLSGGWRSP